MLRAIRSFGAVAVLFGGALLAQPPKDGKDAPAPGGGGDSYLPLKKGNKWTYKVGDNAVKVEVVKVDMVGKEEHFQLDTFVGTEPKMSEWYTVKADGLYRTRVKDDKLEPYVKVLALPVKKDASWEVNTKVGTQTVKGTMKVLDDKEEVTIGGTKYAAVKVEGKDLDVAGAKTTVRTWYVNGKGIIKQEFVLQTNDTVTLTLEKDEIGK
jgi:hypothetical protein